MPVAFDTDLMRVLFVPDEKKDWMLPAGDKLRLTFAFPGRGEGEASGDAAAARMAEGLPEGEADTEVEFSTARRDTEAVGLPPPAVSEGDSEITVKVVEGELETALGTDKCVFDAIGLLDVDA